jgi:hypothetical protein
MYGGIEFKRGRCVEVQGFRSRVRCKDINYNYNIIYLLINYLPGKLALSLGGRLGGLGLKQFSWIDAGWDEFNRAAFILQGVGVIRSPRGNAIGFGPTGIRVIWFPRGTATGFRPTGVGVVLLPRENAAGFRPTGVGVIWSPRRNAAGLAGVSVEDGGVESIVILGGGDCSTLIFGGCLYEDLGPIILSRGL